MVIPTHGLVLLLAVAGVTEAGSHLWQPRISKYDHLVDSSSNHSLTKRAFDELSNPSPIHERSIDKRFLISVPNKARLWPNSEIRYCFETAEDEKALFANIKAAVELWSNSGLQSNFKFTKVTDDQVCQDERSKILVISRSPPDTGHSTTFGYRPADASKGTKGPTMKLDDSSDWGGIENKIGTFAHEIGHAWGLDHEHQNPNFWRSEAPDSFVHAEQGSVWGIDNFHCENIDGYDEALAKAKNDFPDPKVAYNAICRDVQGALHYKFAAGSFLPVPAALVRGSTPPGHTIHDVDFLSIMMYPSNAASSDEDPAYTAPGGTPIVQNWYPTAQDVAGIEILYGLPEELTQPWLNQFGNTMNDVYNQLFAQSRGGQSC